MECWSIQITQVYGILTCTECLSIGSSGAYRIRECSKRNTEAYKTLKCMEYCTVWKRLALLNDVLERFYFRRKFMSLSPEVWGERRHLSTLDFYSQICVTQHTDRVGFMMRTHTHTLMLGYMTLDDYSHTLCSCCFHPEPNALHGSRYTHFIT